MSKRDETKSRIILTSLGLFNEFGPDNVSTVQICNSLKISPGNLYYYFRNKEQIIREIYELMVQEYEENWNFAEMQKPEFNSADRIITNLRIFFKYRFLMNHMSALGNNDSLLREKFSEVTALRQSELKQYFQLLEEQEIMDFHQDTEGIQKLVSVLWFLGDFWLMNKELKCGKITSLTTEMEIEYLLMNSFLTRQFMTEKGLKAFAEKQLKVIDTLLNK